MDTNVMVTVNLFQFTLFVLALLLSSYVFSLGRSKALVAFFLILSAHGLLRGAATIIDFQLIHLSYGITFLYGPLLYFTFREILQKYFSYHIKHAVHLIPFAIALISICLLKASYNQIGAAVMMSQLVYIILCLRLISHMENVMNFTKSTEIPDTIKWLKGALHVYIGFFLFMSGRFFIAFFNISDLLNNIDLAFYVASNLIISFFIFQGLRKVSFIPDTDEEENELARYFHKNNIGKKRQRLENHDHSKWLVTLEEHMRQEQPYKDPQITVKELAAQLEMPSRLLSELINDAYGFSFSEFINRARVNEAKHLMNKQSYSHRSLLDIALTAGFNSKSSFNLMFKRYTGETPSAYRLRLSNNNTKTAINTSITTTI